MNGFTKVLNNSNLEQPRLTLMLWIFRVEETDVISLEREVEI
jgi:hypothetical protein